MFDLLIVAVLQNAEKSPLFSVQGTRGDGCAKWTKQWTDVEWLFDVSSWIRT